MKWCHLHVYFYVVKGTMSVFRSPTIYYWHLIIRILVILLKWWKRMHCKSEANAQRQWPLNHKCRNKSWTVRNSLCAIYVTFLLWVTFKFCGPPSKLFIELLRHGTPVSRSHPNDENPWTLNIWSGYTVTRILKNMVKASCL